MARAKAGLPTALRNASEPRFSQASCALEQLKPLMERVDSIPGVKEMALAYRTAVVPAMDALRYPIDALELLVDKSAWPVPTYGDLMFEV